MPALTKHNPAPQTHTAAELIQYRKDLWQQDQSKDKDFVVTVAQMIVDDPDLRAEVQAEPDLLIELTFLIVDKNQKTVPFFLNDVQKMFMADLKQAITDYLAGKRLHLKFLILKGRQQGFTSVITGYQLACSIVRRNFSGFTLADSAENTETIFEDKAKFPYNNLPSQVKPTEKYNTRRELLFEKINSKWRVATAGNKDIGRSKTINFFHGSEASFWDNIKNIFAGLGQALTPDSIQILESTANGYNEFKDLWDSGKWDNKFYQWWLTPEYRQTFPNDGEEQQFKGNVKLSSEWVFKQCRWLMEFHNLKWEQVYWYYNKWGDLKDLVKQEYPCTEDEAFLATGRCVFDQEAIVRRREHLRRLYKESPPIRGTFLYIWQDPETKNRILNDTIRFREGENGFLTVYEQPQEGYPYVIGGDTKGEGSDFFSATVINNHTGKRAAVLHGQMDPDTYAHQVYCLGRYFNDALISIETNFDIYPVQELQRLQYPRQYVRKQYDTYTGEYQKRFGFKTDGNTRPAMIDRETILLRDNLDLFTDIAMLGECITFIYDKNSRPDAQSGKHDDILFSDMIGNEAREQHTMTPVLPVPDKPPILAHKDKMAAKSRRTRRRLS